MSAIPPFDLDVVDRLLTTTKAVRRRLDLHRPVPREVIRECIRLANYTPNASNSQEWRWVVIDDPTLVRRVGEQYRAVLEPRVRTMRDVKAGDGDNAGVRISESVLYLAEHLAEVPAIVIPCYDVAAALTRYGHVLGGEHSTPIDMDGSMYASILPAVWSFQLALRSRGLGSTLTTAHQLDQPTMADILGIPTTWFQVALLPVAYTTGDDFTPVATRRRGRRHPVERRRQLSTSPPHLPA